MNDPKMLTNWVQRDLDTTQAWLLTRHFAQNHSEKNTRSEKLSLFLMNPAVTPEMVAYLLQTGKPGIVAELFKRNKITFEEIVSLDDEVLAVVVSYLQYTFALFEKVFHAGGDVTRTFLLHWAEQLTKCQAQKMAPVVVSWLETMVAKQRFNEEGVYELLFSFDATVFTSFYTQKHDSVQTRIWDFLYTPFCPGEQKDLQDFLCGTDFSGQEEMLNSKGFYEFFVKTIDNINNTSFEISEALTPGLHKLYEHCVTAGMRPIGFVAQSHPKLRDRAVEGNSTEQFFQGTLTHDTFMSTLHQAGQALMLFDMFDEEMFLKLLQEAGRGKEFYVVKVFKFLQGIYSQKAEKFFNVLLQKHPEVLGEKLASRLWELYPNPQLAVLLPWNCSYIPQLEYEANFTDQVMNYVQNIFGTQEHLWETFLKISTDSEESVQKLVNKTLLLHS